MEFIKDPYLVLDLPLYMLDGTSFMSRDAYGHSCSVTEAIWTPSGRDFDGVDDNISFTLNLDKLGSNYTLEAWAKTDDTSVLRYLMGASVWAAGMFYCRHRPDDKYFTFSVYGGNEVVGATALATDRLYHFVIQVIGGTGQIYLNAEQDGSSNTGHTLSGSHTMYIAKGHGENEWDGLIGEARIYNRALTPQEIQHNYLATKWRYQ